MFSPVKYKLLEQQERTDINVMSGSDLMKTSEVRHSAVVHVYFRNNEKEALERFADDNSNYASALIRGIVVTSLRRGGYLPATKKNGGSVAAEPKPEGVSNERGHTQR